ncbi:MAG: CopG family ribbon-helix-helix protein [Solirubrobacteraceae bacterium]
MRMHISLDDDLVAQLDRRVGRRQRSAFISATIRRALDDEQRWEDIEAGLGALGGSQHGWDADPAGWVATGRAGDAARVG